METKTHLWIFTQLYELGDLQDSFFVNNKIDKGQLYVLLDCAKEIYHLHNQNPLLVHRDVNSQNILLTKENGKFVAKLSDFGLTVISQRGEEGTVDIKTRCGTLPYMAPELLRSFYHEEVVYNKSVDIFGAKARL